MNPTLVCASLVGAGLFALSRGARPTSIYLDWNATTPPHPEVLAAMQDAHRTSWGNPASLHSFGRAAKGWVERARGSVATLTGFDPENVLLTSGGTEANNIALRSVMSGAGGKPVAMVVSRIEHPSITKVAEMLEKRGVRVVWVDPNREGQIAPDAIESAADLATRDAELRLVVLQAVNHETGVIQPIEEAARIAHVRGALLHVDAIQAAGKLPPEVWSGADLLSIAAHKMRGPKGIGALATKPGVELAAIVLGGSQEKGLRPGTQDAALCAGFAAAAHRALSGPARYRAIERLRDRLEAALVRDGIKAGNGPLRNGGEPRAPHVANLSWPGVVGADVCAALDRRGVAVSSGSACRSGLARPSTIINAMLGEERASSAVRISLGEDTTESDIDEAVRRWPGALIEARGA